MNIVGKCRELVHQEFDPTIGGKLDSRWKEVFQHLHTVNVADKLYFARMVGRNVVHLPALSVSTVMDKGLRTVGEKGSLPPLEPTSLSLPAGLVVLRTSNLFPVQVINLSHEDIWFKSLGITYSCGGDSE